MGRRGRKRTCCCGLYSRLYFCPRPMTRWRRGPCYPIRHPLGRQALALAGVLPSDSSGYFLLDACTDVASIRQTPAVGAACPNGLISSVERGAIIADYGLGHGENGGEYGERRQYTGQSGGQAFGPFFVLGSGVGLPEGGDQFRNSGPADCGVQPSVQQITTQPRSTRQCSGMELGPEEATTNFALHVSSQVHQLARKGEKNS